MKVQTPFIARLFYPSLLWKIDTASKEIFLTFDDGPHPEITPKVLNILNHFNAKASFFCVGENIFKFPDVFKEIVRQNHVTGNHTYNHLNGWKTENGEYFDNIEKCGKFLNTGLFRPPYGKIKPSQISYLKRKHKIVMWSVLSYDFSNKISKERCFDIAVKNTVKGSIIVFHDSEKAARNMLYVLPRFLEHFSNLGYKFPVIL
jgi:peptidoglycan/xylan/chitin deacetylase (PgdA/CDA1 family)